jgi:hypothetical protein
MEGEIIGIKRIKNLAINFLGNTKEKSLRGDCSGGFSIHLK